MKLTVYDYLAIALISGSLHYFLIYFHIASPEPAALIGMLSGSWYVTIKRYFTQNNEPVSEDRIPENAYEETYISEPLLFDLESELVITNNKVVQRNGLIIMSVAIALCSGAFLFTRSIKSSWLFVNALIAFFQFFLAVMIVLFILGLFFGALEFINNKPAAVINKKGMWVKHFGFIEWDNIQQVEIYKVYNTPMESVGIRVKDTQLLSRQAQFFGKMAVMWSKIFGYPPILLSNLECENRHVVCFANNFIKK